MLMARLACCHQPRRTVTNNSLMDLPLRQTYAVAGLETDSVTVLVACSVTGLETDSVTVLVACSVTGLAACSVSGL